MFKEKQRPATTIGDINFYIEQAQNLAYEYNVQYKMLEGLGDYTTVDIASDWVWKSIKNGIMRMYEEKYINENVLKLYKEIDTRFNDVSMNGKHYDEEIWTLKALEHNPFWDEQRKLAREILTELKKINLK